MNDGYVEQQSTVCLMKNYEIIKQRQVHLNNFFDRPVPSMIELAVRANGFNGAVGRRHD
jgi:hypothetical protein